MGRAAIGGNAAPLKGAFRGRNQPSPFWWVFRPLGDGGRRAHPQGRGACEEVRATRPGYPRSRPLTTRQPSASQSSPPSAAMDKSLATYTVCRHIHRHTQPSGTLAHAASAGAVQNTRCSSGRPIDWAPRRRGGLWKIGARSDVRHEPKIASGAPGATVLFPCVPLARSLPFRRRSRTPFL